MSNESRPTTSCGPAQNLPHDVDREPVHISVAVDEAIDWFNIGQTCCGKCEGATCYVDYLTGERS